MLQCPDSDMTYCFHAYSAKPKVPLYGSQWSSVGSAEGKVLVWVKNRKSVMLWTVVNIILLTADDFCSL